MDHVSVGSIIVIRVVTLLVSNQKLLKGCSKFIQTLQKDKASLMQVKFKLLVMAFLKT